MKILHTSDWHLGHTINGFDRTEEQTEMLGRIIEVTVEQKPDAFLISGDIFHTSQPSAAVQTLLAEALMQLHVKCPGMPIISIAGNHDSPSKHDIFRSPWKVLGVHTFGTIDTENPEHHIVEIPGKGLIAAVPYTHTRNLPADFFGRLNKETAQRTCDGLPAVLVAHATIAGCDFTGHDSGTELSVGGIDSIAAESLGDAYDYIALGHIHHPQTLPGTKRRVRYCGTPLAVNFTESYAHSISIVELAGHGVPPIVSTIEIPPTVPLVSIPARGFATWEEAIRLLSEFPDCQPAYIRLCITADGTVPADAAMQAHRICEAKRARFCRLNIERTAGTGTKAKRMTVAELKEATPLEMACRYAADTGVEFNDEMKEMFNFAAFLAEKTGSCRL